MNHLPLSFAHGVICPSCGPSEYEEADTRTVNAGCLLRDMLVALHDIESHRVGMAGDTLTRLLSLSHTHPRALPYLLHLVGGGFLDWDKSFADRGRETFRSKQAVEKEELEIGRSIAKLLPELGDLIISHGGRLQHDGQSKRKPKRDARAKTRDDVTPPAKESFSRAGG
jgi:hypothetical protein